MKNFFVFLGILAVVFYGVLAKVQVNNIGLIYSRALAQCDTQDPYSSCFAPGETSDPIVPDATCDTQDPDSPCFAPGEKADTPTPTNYSTPTYNTPKSTTTVTPLPQASYPSQDDILKMTGNDDSGGVGLLGALFLSPIMSMIVSVIGFFVIIGIIILVIVVLVRRSNKKNIGSEQPDKSEKENETKENK